MSAPSTLRKTADSAHMSLNTTSWAQTATPSPEVSALSGTVGADVAIVGGGFTGFSAALHLAKAGRSVVVLEAREIGWGCSSRNAGRATPSWWSVLPQEVIDRHGEERGGRMNRMIADAGGLLENLIMDNHIACDYRKSGLLIFADNDKQRRAMEAQAEQWAPYGHRFTSVPRQEVPGYIPTDRYEAGAVHHDNVTLNPASYVRGLASAAQKAGAVVHTGSPALAVERDGGGWRVSTPGGAVTAGQVVIGTNGYTDGLWPGLDRTFYRMTVAMFASEPYPGGEKAILLKGVPCREMSGAAMFSLQFDSRGCLIAGNWPTIRKNLSAQRVARPHDIKFARIFPQMPLPKWRDVWYGQLCLMLERMPKVFRLADGVHAAMGYSGIGVCAATALGREVAQMISSGDEDACAMPVSAPRPAPFARAIPVLTDFAVNPLMRLSYRFG